MTEKATISKKKGKTTYIRLEKKSQCDTCKACLFGKEKSIIMPAISNIECKIGDVVLVEIPDKKILLAPIFLYAVPLLFMLIGALIGMRISETFSVGLSFALLLVSIACVYLIDKLYFRKNPKFNPVIIEKLADKSVTTI